MKVLILHGTDGKPDANWFPWLKQKFEAEGCKVWVPQLPESHTPNKKVWGDFLFNSDWDFNDNIVIGHSAGAVQVLNMLMDGRCPNVKLAVCVGAWAHGTPATMEDYQFANLFPENGFDFDTIQQKAERIEFMHGSDDPYCPPEQAQFLADKLNAPINIIQGAKHFSSECTELPELWAQLKNTIEIPESEVIR